MPGTGTLINVAAIVFGGLAGLAGSRFLTEKIQNTVMMVCGICTMFIAIGGVVSKMLVLTDTGFDTQGSMMMIGSLIIGALIGEALQLEDRLENFGEWLKKKTGNSGDAGFVNAFVTASLTVCIGAMAVVGSIEDGIYGNYSILAAKSVLDCVIVAIMASSLGKGAVFSAVSVGIFQGIITVLARLIAPLLTDGALFNLSYVGNVMIFSVGLNIVFGKKVRVASLLPGLIVAAVWSYFG